MDTRRLKPVVPAPEDKTRIDRAASFHVVIAKGLPSGGRRPMIQKKICMLGSFAVGKTSLVRRFVHSMFTDKYLTTVGVKIDTKKIVLRDKEISLLLWDLYGEDEFQRVQISYLRGSSGLLLVADGTRPETVDKAISSETRRSRAWGNIPYLLLMNKCDRATMGSTARATPTTCTERVEDSTYQCQDRRRSRAVLWSITAMMLGGSAK